MRIISIMNQKGGCGKTTTAINLSAFLAEFGKKVLLIDLDPQGHSTAGFNIKENMIELGLFDVFTKQASLEDIIKLQVYPGLDLAPTTVRLSAIEQYLSGTFERERQLRYHLEKLQLPFIYDYIIIDCPPHLGLLVFNALMASGEVIVPIEPSSFSLQGINKLLETIELLKENAHHLLKVMALPTIYNHHSHFSREILKQILNKFQDLTLKAVIRQNVKLKEAAQKGCPISVYDRQSFGAEDYQSLAFEIIQQDEPSFIWPGKTPKEEKQETPVESVSIQPEIKEESFVQEIMVIAQPSEKKIDGAPQEERSRNNA
ncbi:MAG: ParA family protein [Nitrospirae bacterium]|nr:ParA family protein [Nitrospirota bacterium]MBI3352817.1 ParA family protein [Nitrospirota bacterium]